MRDRTGGRFVGVAVAFAAGIAGVACSGGDGASSAPDAEVANEMDAASDAVAFDGPFEVPLGPTIRAMLTGCGGPGYAATFTIGSQSFQLTIDTGSGTLAVASSVCTSCGVTPEYTPGAAAGDDGQQVSDTYLAGSWQGEVYTDSVQLAGTSAPVTMRLAAIQEQNAFFGDSGCAFGTVPFAPQGIVGFGPSGLAVAGTDAFVTTLTQGSRLPAVFAVELCPVGGQLMFGGVDPVAGALTGPAVYTPLLGSAYYTVEIDDLGLGGNSLGFGPSDFGGVAVDTGTSVLALPTAVFQALVSAIEATPAFALAFEGTMGWLGTTQCLTSTWTPAQIDQALPSLTLAFPGADAGTISLDLKPTQSYLPPTTANGATYYCSGIYENPLATGTVLGTSVMLGQMVIFDVDGQRIGFAPESFCP